MRRIITTALLAVALLPAVAQAQSQQDIDRDHRELYQDRRDARQDQANGDYRGMRQDRRELREDRHDARQDIADRDRRWARDDWRSWRQNHRDVYAGAGWRAPFRYTAFQPGARIQPAFYGNQYVIAQPWRYHLPTARPGTRWVRHYNDVLLVDYGRGSVVDVLRGFFF